MPETSNQNKNPGSKGIPLELQMQFAKQNGLKVNAPSKSKVNGKKPLNKTLAKMDIESDDDEPISPIAKPADNRSVSKNYNDTSGFPMAPPRVDTLKLESIKSELLEIFEEAGSDSNWLRHDFKLLDKSSSKESHMMDIEIKVIKLFASKLRRERENRLKTEQQFQNLMEKYTRQMEFIEENFKNPSSVKSKEHADKTAK
jgi:hypothetical protein